MDTYKITDEGVCRNGNTFIVEDGTGWAEYQDWLVAGGVPEPMKTADELLEDARSEKLSALAAERDSRTDAAVGTSSGRKKDKTISRSVKLLRKELKGNASPAEIAELDALEGLDDFLEALSAEHDTVAAWLSDQARTIEEIQAYDVVTGPGWSTI